MLKQFIHHAHEKIAAKRAYVRIMCVTNTLLQTGEQCSLYTFRTGGIEMT